MTRLLLRVPDRWVKHLDGFNFWIGVAYFALVVVVVAGIFINQRASAALARQARADAVKVAEQRSNAQSAYTRCVESIPQLQAISTHVGGVNDGFRVLLQNSRAALAATPPTDPLYPVRRANLARLERAVKKVAAISAFPVPTAAGCRARRDEALRQAGFKTG